MTRPVDTILGHCLIRAMIATGVTDPKKASVWLAAKVTPKASRVATFIVMWAYAMRDEGGADIGIEAYARWTANSRATAYRHQADFRELFPEFENPNAIARHLLAQVADRKKITADVAVAL